MSLQLERQTVYLGGGMKKVAWLVYDGNEMVRWYWDYDTAHQRAHDIIEQREHRDGV